MKKLSGWLVIVFAVLTWTASNKSTVLPDSSDILPSLSTDPIQERESREPFQVSVDEFSYQINPLYKYELYGLVVSKHHSDSWFDYHHKRWNDFLNIADLCVVWGSNADKNLHKQMAFENTTWTCWVQPQSHAAANAFKGTALSNNHLLSEDSYIVDKIKSAEVGDQIYLSGSLAEYQQGSFSRGTSTVRDDTGNGACETIYVDEFDILKTANDGWRSLYTLFFIATILSALYFLFGGSPYKYR